MKWEVVKLADIADVFSGYAFKSSDMLTSEGVPLIKIKNINNRIVSAECDSYLNPAIITSKYDKYIMQDDDFLVAMTGQGSVGRIGKMPTILEKYYINQRVGIVRVDSRKAIPHFIFLQMADDTTEQILFNKANGAGQPNLSPAQIGEVEIVLPPKVVQKRITDILSAYDDLIENNQKQIKLLEEAAMRLYKEWFVKLRFPRHENTKIVDGVPEGWEYKEVGSLISKTPRTKQVKKSEYKNSGEIPIIDQSREFIAGYTDDRETIVDLGVPVIVFGDHTRILKLINFPFAKGADGTQLIVSGLEEMPQHLLYCSLLNIDLSNYHYARHFKYLKASKIIVPTKNISEEFESIVEIYFKVIQILRDKIFLLQKSRDFLLPKLMNGEIEV